MPTAQISVAAGFFYSMHNFAHISKSAKKIFLNCSQCRNKLFKLILYFNSLEKGVMNALRC
jgi:hypothetical protein